MKVCAHCGRAHSLLDCHEHIQRRRTRAAKRNEIAVIAMEALILQGLKPKNPLARDNTHIDPEEVACLAYSIADAMMRRGEDVDED